MQVKLITTVETIIDIDPENTEDFETAKREIFGNFNDQCDEEDDACGDIKSAHSAAVVFDTIRAQSVTTSFEEVK